MWNVFIFLVALLARLLRAACKSRDELVLENLALRQQVTALKLGRHRAKLHDADRAFWIALRKSWANWASRLLIVKPETVVDWQRRRFRRHWTRISPQGRRSGRSRVKALHAEPSRTAYRCPWQNPVAERWIGSLHREVLDHVVVLGQQHLIRLVNSYIRYYHEDRCHLGLGRDTPDRRLVTPRPSTHAKVVALPRVGGLHHRYVWRAGA